MKLESIKSISKNGEVVYSQDKESLSSEEKILKFIEALKKVLEKYSKQ